MPKRTLKKLRGTIAKSPASKEVNLKWDDEEIEDMSDVDESEDEGSDQSSDDGENDITGEQKRKRLARAYLDAMGAEESDSQGSSEDDSDGKGDISFQLKRHRLESQGKYVRRLAHSFSNLEKPETAKSSHSFHNSPVTCVALSTDDSTVYSGSKDNSVVRCDIEYGTKDVLLPKWRRSQTGDLQSHDGEVLSVAVSSDGRYVASGGRDKLIRIFDSRTNSEIKSFPGHRDAVTCLSFQRDSYSLFSGSLDRCIKHWDLNEMGYLETLFGHQDGISSMDCWLKEKPVTGSADRSVRVWKVSEESHLVFRGHTSCVDNVQYLSPDTYASSGQDGSLCMWKESQKKPVASVHAAHGMENPVTPRWISSMASLKVSDVLASGSHDGFLRLWKADAEERSLAPVAEWSTGNCFVNAIALSPRLAVIGTGSEHRLGRWWRLKGAKNKVEVFRLPESIGEEGEVDELLEEDSDENSSEEESSEDDTISDDEK